MKGIILDIDEKGRQRESLKTEMAWEVVVGGG
jgi:hypothetical protein